jgi:hypothetical protein
MKTFVLLVASVVALAGVTTWAQSSPPPQALPSRPVAAQISQPLPPPPASRAEPQQGGLTKFDLDFLGGKPKELVDAIQKAMDRRINVIVPDEFADVKLPALKMERVNIAQLFDALVAVGRKSEAVTTGNHYGANFANQYQVVQTGYGFRQANPGQAATDDTIWYFYVDKPALPPISSSAKVCRFYPLASYLDHHFTVDDITTAIETGWKMLGESPTPTISFHKDTRLLIAVGEPSKLETVDAVLRALDGSKSELHSPMPAAPSPAPRPNDEQKSNANRSKQ